MTFNTIAIKPNIEPRAIGPLQAFSPSCLDFTKTLSLETSNSTTRTAAHETLVERIAEIVASYRISGPGDRYEDVMKRKMLDTLRSFVARQEPINMVMPVYPFKSPSRESKVLGPDTDVSERMSLQHFNSIDARI